MTISGQQMKTQYSEDMIVTSQDVPMKMTRSEQPVKIKYSGHPIKLTFSERPLKVVPSEQQPMKKAQPSSQKKTMESKDFSSRHASKIKESVTFDIETKRKTTSLPELKTNNATFSSSLPTLHEGSSP